LYAGANTGLGLEIVKALLKSPQPYKVFLGTRSVDNGEAAKKQLLVEVPESKSSIDTVQIDVASDESIEAAFEAVKAKTDRIDTLIANAGVSLDMAVIAGKLGRREAWNQMADVNISGSHIFSQ
jgi:NAD(P)-dependent dehydrogenase (short-subunit alcohol dehydrogenase family)